MIYQGTFMTHQWSPIIMIIRTTDSSGRVIPDISLLAPDCFHFLKELHSRSGVWVKRKLSVFCILTFTYLLRTFALIFRNIWNHLLSPPSNRITNVQRRIPITCPSEKVPYFFTKFNSVWSQWINAYLVSWLWLLFTLSMKSWKGL